MLSVKVIKTEIRSYPNKQKIAEKDIAILSDIVKVIKPEIGSYPNEQKIADKDRAILSNKVENMTYKKQKTHVNNFHHMNYTITAPEPEPPDPEHPDPKPQEAPFTIKKQDCAKSNDQPKNDKISNHEKQANIIGAPNGEYNDNIGNVVQPQDVPFTIKNQDCAKSNNHLENDKISNHEKQANVIGAPNGDYNDNIGNIVQPQDVSFTIKKQDCAKSNDQLQNDKISNHEKQANVIKPEIRSYPNKQKIAEKDIAILSDIVKVIKPEIKSYPNEQKSDEKDRAMLSVKVIKTETRSYPNKQTIAEKDRAKSLNILQLLPS
jgi:type 1 fimbria pilin